MVRIYKGVGCECIQPILELCAEYPEGVGCECIQPILELCAEYPGVFCVCAFFLVHGEICSWYNLWLNFVMARCFCLRTSVQPWVE